MSSGDPSRTGATRAGSSAGADTPRWSPGPVAKAPATSARGRAHESAAVGWAFGEPAVDAPAGTPGRIEADGRRGAPAGRNRITARALDRLMSAVAAEALGVDARTVSVDLSDDSGRLVLAVSAPIRVVPLARVAAGVGVLVRDGGPLLERAARAQDRIRSRAADLSGYEIDRVGIRLRGAEIRVERRVK